MIPNIYSDDIEVEIFARENAIECDELHSVILRDLEYLSESVFNESGDSENQKECGIIGTICDKIGKMIKSIINFIKGIFSSIGMVFGKRLRPEDYVNAESTKIQLQTNAEELQKELETELVKSNKIVEAISKKTGIDPRVVDEKYQDAKKVAIASGGAIITAALACVIGNKINKSVFKGQKQLEKIDQLKDDIEQEARKSDNLKTEKYQKQNKEKLAALSKVTASLGKAVRPAVSAYHDIVNGLGRVSNRSAKITKKNKKGMK